MPATAQASSLSEVSPLIPTAPAIANALYDAIGVRIHELPLTRERVLAALAARGDGPMSEGVLRA